MKIQGQENYELRAKLEAALAEVERLRGILAKCADIMTWATGYPLFSEEFSTRHQEWVAVACEAAKAAEAAKGEGYVAR